MKHDLLLLHHMPLSHYCPCAYRCDTVIQLANNGVNVHISTQRKEIDAVLFLRFDFDFVSILSSYKHNEASYELINIYNSFVIELSEPCEFKCECTGSISDVNVDELAMSLCETLISLICFSYLNEHI